MEPSRKRRLFFFCCISKYAAIFVLLRFMLKYVNS
nr:MAG TPA: hypothetical protein [Caudoviricetes sp.]